MSETVKYNVKHEKIVLGTLLRNADARRKYCKILQGREIHADRHKLIFAALQALESQGLAYTPGTITTLLPQGADWGGNEYLAKLESEALPDLSNIEFHIERMRWDCARIHAIENDVPCILNDLKDPRSDSEEIIRSTQELATTLSNTRTAQYFEGGNPLANRYSASITARQITPSFRSSGYRVLDKDLVEGFAAGKVSVIAGASSNGKTSFMLNMAARQSRSWKVGILPWERGIQSAIDSLVSIGLHIPLQKLIKFAQMLTTEEQKNIDDYVANLLNNDNISFLKQPPRSVLSGKPWEVNNQLLDWVEGQFEDWKRDIVYWDLFVKKLASREPDRVSAALDRVQEMSAADRLNQHTCLLHQVNLKTVESQKDQRPTRADLKGTGGWMEMPDLVLTVYRPSLYEPGTIDNIMEISCLKQTSGPWPWKVLADWDGETVCINKMRKGTYYASETSENSGYGDNL